MSKRALMLTVATAALLSGPVLGADDTDIKTKVTTEVKTSTANNGSPGNVLIESGGSVVLTTGGPAVEIDSANTVTNQGTISNVGTDNAIGVRLDATAAGNGPGATITALDSKATIDLSGDKGTEKTAVLVGIANSDTTGIFNGGIDMETGSTIKVTGDSAVGVAIGNSTTLNGAINLGGTMTLSGGTDMTGVLIGTTTGSATPATVNGDLTFASGSGTTITGDGSFGVHITQNSVLNGNLDMEGTITMSPTTANSSTSGASVGIQADSNTGPYGITGNLTIGNSSALSVTGNGALGVVLLSGLEGNFTNSGTITVTGTTQPSSTGSNAVAGSAVIIASNVGGGILNNGPISSTDTQTAAVIEGNGSAPVVLISPVGDGATASANLTIAQYNSALPEGNFSFVNRGTLTAAPTNPDQVTTTTLRIEGAGTFTTTLTDGIFSSGKIAAAAAGDTKQSAAMTVTAISVGDGAVIPLFENSIQDSAAPGSVTAAYSGSATGGSAVAININAGGSLAQIINQGTISAAATNTNTTISSLIARGIWDQSGTLAEIDNSGTISATATTLDNNEQAAIAIDMSVSTQNTKIDNSGVINGQVNLGSGADFVWVHGTTNQAASITGDIAFGGTSSTTTADDDLQIDDHGTVTGAVSERAGGRLDVTINPGGVLTLTNDSIDPTQRFEVNNLTVSSGATLGLGLSQTYNIAVNPTAGGIVTASGPVTINPQAILDLPFQSFLAGQKPGDSSEFILVDAPLGDLTLDLPGLQNQLCGQVPFLFQNTGSQCLSTQTNGDRSQLVLNLVPKTAAQIGLTGYAAKMFPLANLALTNDDQLGAAVIQAGNPVNGVPLTQAQGQSLYQGIYTQFAPNVTGASRALAIAITDQATGPVGARQQELRMYSGQPGDTTLWAQEFNLSLNADADANTIGYRDTGFGLAMGMDGGDPANGRYGGALTFYSGDINEKQPRKSKTNSEWAVLTGYSDWRGRGLFFDTQLSAGVGELDGKRLLQVSGIDRAADGKRAALLGAIGATTGAIFTMGSTVFTPMMSLDGMAMREEGYTEHGGGDPDGSGDAFDLKVSPNYYDSARVFVGADVRQDLNLGDFYLQPQARAGYRYDLLADAEKVKASFASTPGTDFTLTGPDPDKGNLVLGGSLATTTGAWSIGVNYDYIRGTQGSVSQEGTLTLVGRI